MQWAVLGGRRQPGRELGLEKDHEGHEDLPGDQSKARSWCSNPHLGGFNPLLSPDVAASC